MKISLELIISAIALLGSIVSPVATALIQKRYGLKMKRLDVYEKRRLDALENYTKAIQSSIVSRGTSPEYREHGSVIRIYAPVSVYACLDQIDELLHEAEYGNEASMKVRHLLTTVLQAMNPLGLKN